MYLFVKVCLFGASEVSLRDIMRQEGSSDEQLLNVISQAVLRKKPKHAGLYFILCIRNVTIFRLILITFRLYHHITYRMYLCINARYILFDAAVVHYDLSITVS